MLTERVTGNHQGGSYSNMLVLKEEETVKRTSIFLRYETRSSDKNEERSGEMGRGLLSGCMNGKDLPLRPWRV